MSQAYDALSLANQSISTTVENSIKRLLRVIASDDVILCFKDGSYLVYKYNKASYRYDRLVMAMHVSELPFDITDEN